MDIAMKRCRRFVAGCSLLAAACYTGPGETPSRFMGAADEVRLVTLDPGHFHAALVQQYDYAQVDNRVHVYAPEGRELESHLALIEQFNNREDDPTSWRPEVYRGGDFLERMLAERAGNVLVVAGNNGRKIEYVRRAIEAGMNVLADKPMIIVPESFELLRDALALADAEGLMVNDIMTERHAITSILQRELSRVPELFGELERGSFEEPAITKESVHYFSKTVAGEPLIRPAWFFDVSQQGEAIVDVSTHLVDLILWQGFADEPIDYANPTEGVEVIAARTWTTPLTEEQFRQVTNASHFPEYLAPYVDDGVLNVPANGEFTFTVRGVHARVSVLWGYENPMGSDTHFSIMRGTRANLVIRQEKPQNFAATLYVEPAAGADQDRFGSLLEDALDRLRQKYPGLSARLTGLGWEIMIPDELREGHEEHFTRVTEQYLASLVNGTLPGWERTNLLTKYYITTKAYELSR